MDAQTIVASVSKADILAMSDAERSRFLGGRYDWRECDWQDHCGDVGCVECDGLIPSGDPVFRKLARLAVDRALTPRQREGDGGLSWRTDPKRGDEALETAIHRAKLDGYFSDGDDAPSQRDQQPSPDARQVGR